MSQDTIGIVLDTGSAITKAGFANEAFPRATFPTAVARFRHRGLLDGLPLLTCGKEAILKRGLSSLTHPVQAGLITDWSDMEMLWHHIFYKELRIPPESTRVMHSVHPLISERDKEKISEILFESFTIKELYLMKSPVLALHASGKTTGVVWDGGYSCSYVAPVFEGFPLKHATMLSPLNGQLLTKRLQKLLAEAGYSFTTDIEMDLLSDMKEKHCYVSRDFDTEMKQNCPEMSYILPDGQQIKLGNERIDCTEVLFDPSKNDLDCFNLIDLLVASIKKCDLDYKPMFFNNIVLAGGTSMFLGLEDRLKAELTNLLRNKNFKANITAMPCRQYASWTGGSILASLDSLKEFWVTKSEYEDGGPERVRYKFF